MQHIPKNRKALDDNGKIAEKSKIDTRTVSEDNISLLSFLEDSISLPEFNFKFLKLYRLENKKQRFIGFVQELFGYSAEEAEAAYQSVLKKQFAKAAGKEKFADRPSGEDAIAFYTRVWVADLTTGAVNRHHILRDDPGLIQAVRSRANKLAGRNGGTGPDFYPLYYPPPHGPDPTLPPEVEESRARNRKRMSVKTPRPRIL